MQIKKDVSLSEFTTIKIGGPADYFFVAENKKDLIKAISYAKEYNLPFFVLGGGSNVLFSDKGYKRLVIKIQNPKLQITNKIQNSGIYAEAGVKLGDLVKLSIEESLTGLEWAAGIPGTVGGAIYGNAGAFGAAIGDSIKEVEVFNADSGKITNFSKDDCLFSNKETIFKKKKDLIIISAVFDLKKGDKDEIQKRTEENIDYRAKSHPLDFPSAGCAFKNYGLKIVNKESSDGSYKD